MSKAGVFVFHRPSDFSHFCLPSCCRFPRLWRVVCISISSMDRIGPVLQTVFYIPDQAEHTSRYNYTVNFLKCLILSEPNRSNSDLSVFHFHAQCLLTNEMPVAHRFLRYFTVSKKSFQHLTHLGNNNSIHASLLQRHPLSITLKNSHILQPFLLQFTPHALMWFHSYNLKSLVPFC